MTLCERCGKEIPIICETCLECGEGEALRSNGLLPCPFCGTGVAYIKKHDSYGDHWDIGCGGIGCYLENGADWWEDRDMITKKWNRRAR
jgi:hypothetical protein